MYYKKRLREQKWRVNKMNEHIRLTLICGLCVTYKTSIPSLSNQIEELSKGLKDGGEIISSLASLHPGMTVEEAKILYNYITYDIAVIR